jgi:SMC interacting uncharacterized protein involved in chromosome segregation
MRGQVFAPDRDARCENAGNRNTIHEQGLQSCDVEDACRVSRKQIAPCANEEGSNVVRDAIRDRIQRATSVRVFLS